MIQFKRGTTKALSSKELDAIIQKSIKEVLGEGHNFTMLDLLFPTLSTITGAADLAQKVNAKIKANMAASEGSWEKIILSNGQPGYDRRTHKLKIGDGISSWQELPNVGGLDYDQVLDSEKKAKIRQVINPADRTVFTYGTEAPDANIVGQIYLHQYNGDIETDYVTETGINKNWYYRKWYSGYFECWTTMTYKGNNSVNINSAVGSLFVSDNIGGLEYPIVFDEPPTEVISVEAISFSPPTSAKDDDKSTVDSIIFISAALSKDGEAINTTTTKSRHVYLTSPVALNAEVSLNIITKGVIQRQR